MFILLVISNHILTSNAKVVCEFVDGTSKQCLKCHERILYLTYFGGGIHGQAVYKSCAVESQFMGYFFLVQGLLCTWKNIKLWAAQRRRI